MCIVLGVNRQYYYWYLTEDGINYLKEYLNLPKVRWHGSWVDRGFVGVVLQPCTYTSPPLSS